MTETLSRQAPTLLSSKKLSSPTVFKALVTLGAVTVFAFAVTLGLAEVYTLVADADITIRRVVNQADSPANTIGKLTAGGRAIVVGCEDYKSDLALIVQTETGAVGYVSNGAFHLKREGLSKYLLSDPERLVWSCRGFFDTRKVDWRKPPEHFRVNGKLSNKTES